MDEPEYSAADLKTLGAKWVERIRAVEADKRFDAWCKDAAAAEKAYLCDETSDTTGDVPDFNILHSNVETIVPAIYNSTPKPDVRPRHSNNDPVAKVAAQIIERATATQVDDSRLDGEVERAAQDAFMAGRGVVRIRFDATVEGAAIRDERIEFEVVPWNDYREGPARRWKDVPWVAYRHWLSRERLQQLEDRTLAQDGERDEAVEGEVWEIWCRETGKVYFVTDASAKVIKVETDPLGLTGFFPQAEPIQPITATNQRTPVCPYKVYKTLADELDTITRRINKLIGVMKARGMSAGDLADLERLGQADDGDIIAVQNVEGLIAQGGLEKAVMWWPIETIIAVVRELYVQRDQTKQTIYEITGISDIVRGASQASETATAQQIKTQWGSLRIRKMQRLVERQVRSIFVICAEILGSKFTPETLALAAGMEIPPEAAALLQSPLKHYRINVESDSTVRADLTQSRGEMAEFLNGTAQYFSTMAPVVQQAPQSAGPLVEMYSAFARQFNLGKQAEDALERFAELAKQSAASPQPNPEAEARRAEMEGKAAEMQARQAEAQADMALKRDAATADMALKAKVAEADVMHKAALLGLEREKLAAAERERAERMALERDKMAMQALDGQARAGMDRERFEVEKAGLALQGKPVQMADGSEGKGLLERLVGEATEAVRAEAVTSEQRIMGAIEMLAQAIQQANAQIVAAMTAPKELVRDENGRPVGVRIAEQRVN